MRYYEIVHRPKTQSATNRIARDESHLQHDAGKFGQVVDVCGCLVTLPKPSHILLVRPVTMRPFLTLVAIVVSGSAQAQFPYNYAPYTPRYPPDGGICPACPGSITCVDIPGNAGRTQRDPRQGGCPAARLVGSTRPSGARLGQPSDCYGCLVPSPEQPLWREHLRNIRRARDAGRGCRLLGQGSAGIRHSQQYLLRRLRPLYADRLGQDTSGGLRRRHRSTARGLGLQLRSPGNVVGYPTVLSSQGKPHGHGAFH